MENPCAEIKLYPRYFLCDTQENADLAVEALWQAMVLALILEDRSPNLPWSVSKVKWKVLILARVLFSTKLKKVVLYSLTYGCSDEKLARNLWGW